MTVRESLYRVLKLAEAGIWETESTNVEEALNADAIEIIEWLLEVKPLQLRQILDAIYKINSSTLLYPEVSAPLLMGLLEYYKTLKDMKEAGL